jgi:hypothetical protein
MRDIENVGRDRETDTETKCARDTKRDRERVREMCKILKERKGEKMCKI